MIPKNLFDCQKEGFMSSQAQAISSAVLGRSFWYHANPKTKKVMPTKKGLAGSSQEKVEAMPLTPANKASKGVIQQSELNKAARIPLVKREFFIVLLNKKRRALRPPCYFFLQHAGNSAIFMSYGHSGVPAKGQLIFGHSVVPSKGQPFGDELMPKARPPIVRMLTVAKIISLFFISTFLMKHDPKIS